MHFTATTRSRNFDHQGQESISNTQLDGVSRHLPTHLYWHKRVPACLRAADPFNGDGEVRPGTALPPILRLEDLKAIVLDGSDVDEDFLHRFLETTKDVSR